MRSSGHNSQGILMLTFGIFCTIRAGSTHLCHLLNGHPNVACYGEIFNIYAPKYPLLDAKFTGETTAIGCKVTNWDLFTERSTQFLMMAMIQKPVILRRNL